MRYVFITLLSLLVTTAFSQTKLTHSASESMTGGSVNCNVGGAYHTDNYYIRRFELDDFAIMDTAHILYMEVGISGARSITGTQTVHGTLYTLTGDLLFANFNFKTTKSIGLRDTSNAMIQFQYTGFFLPGDTVISEFFTPTGSSADSNYCGVGFNNVGETDDSYLAAPTCGISEPGGLDTTAGGFPNSHLVMNVLVNQRPYLTPLTVNGFQDADFDFTETHIRLAFVDSDADKPQLIRIRNLPSEGTLLLSGSPVSVGDTIERLDFDDMTYRPDPGYVGIDSFEYSARDKHHWTLNAEQLKIRMQSTSSISELSNEIRIYPNPVQDVLTIEGKYTGAALYNVLGEEVHVEVIDNKIDVSRLVNGMYFIKLTGPDTGVSSFIKN